MLRPHKAQPSSTLEMPLPLCDMLSRHLIAGLEEQLGQLSVFRIFGAYDVRSAKARALFENVNLDVGPPQLDQGRLQAVLSLFNDFFAHFGSTEKKQLMLDGAAVVEVPVPALFDKVNENALKKELPLVLVEMMRLPKCKTFSEACLQFLQSKHSDAYLHTARLLSLALILPMGTASVERFFSKQKLIQHYLGCRKRLDTFRNCPL